MYLTKELLQEKNACSDGLDWFITNFPKGGEYQEVLNRCAEDDRPSYASWALSTFGETDTVIELESITGTHFFFAGSIRVSGSISLSGFLGAGSGIEAGEGIKAGSGIEAGWGIEAGEDIGIFAGLKIKIVDWNLHAKVIAKFKPKNLISGYWVENENESN